MTTYQDIKDQMEVVVAKNDNIHMMTREDIFMYLAELVATSQLISDFIRDLDGEIIAVEEAAYRDNTGASVALIERIIKRKTAELVKDKNWANRQLTTLKDIRIGALAAQRSTE